MLLSMKLPSLIPAMTADIARGDCAVVQLVSTSEAMLDRALADLSPEERAWLDIELSPREYLIDYLTAAFPVRQMQTFTDDSGTVRSEPMVDEAGHPVLCREAVAMRDQLLERLCALPVVGSALDHIIGHFGTDAAAEVTGRSRRVVIGADGRQRIERRTARTNLAETDAFMRGEKRILIFSDAGGTGRSYHASLDAPNRARRIHYLLEPGWRADSAIQGLGRTHRTHQACAPLFRPVSTDCRGERRFISTIARRLDSLGALTRGQRQTGGQGLFDPRDNLESDFARESLERWFHLLSEGKLESISLDRFEDLKAAILRPTYSLTDDDGRTVRRYELVRPTRTERHRQDMFAETHWRDTDRALFEQLWRAECDEMAAQTRTQVIYLVTGLLLPVWGKLPDDHVQVWRLTSDDGQSLLGRLVPAPMVERIASAFGIAASVEIGLPEKIEHVRTSGETVAIGGLRLKRSFVAGAHRFELLDWLPEALPSLKAAGCFTEIIQHRTRLFVPIDRAAAILAVIGN